MDNGKRKRQPRTRRWIQLYSALLYNAYGKGFLDGEIYPGQGKYACVPGLNCYSCPGAVGACPLGALQNALASAGHRPGWYVMGILLLFGTVLGRSVCGWLCPVGLLQELLHRIPTLKIKKGPVTRRLSHLKYAVLGLFVIALPLWYGLRQGLPLPGFCKYICPAGTLEGALGLLLHPNNRDLFPMLGRFFTGKLVLLLILGLACLFCYRSFCRFVCPLGAIYGLFNRFCLVGVKVDTGKCDGCGACVRRCPMDVGCVGDRECIHCGECLEVCPRQAIALRAGGITLRAPGPVSAGESHRRAARWVRAAALALLGLVLLWFNVLDPAVRSPQTPGEASAEAAPTGYEPGMPLEDFTLPCLDGSVFRLSEHRGQVCMINLWATYCGPCVGELPYFDELLRQHPGELAVLAVHSSLVTEDPAAFLSGRDYAMAFAVDTEEDSLWQIVGGSATLPQTIVLDQNGIVIYNRIGSVTPQLLAALYARAASEGEEP